MFLSFWFISSVQKQQAPASGVNVSRVAQGLKETRGKYNYLQCIVLHISKYHLADICMFRATKLDNKISNVIGWQKKRKFPMPLSGRPWQTLDKLSK
jgi:hypothetical protein